MVYRQHRIRSDRLGFNRSQLPDTNAAVVFPPCSKRNRTRYFAAPRPTHWPDWLSPRPPKPTHRRPIPRRQLRPPLRRGNLLEGPVPPWPLVASLLPPSPGKYAPFARLTRRLSSKFYATPPRPPSGRRKVTPSWPNRPEAFSSCAMPIASRSASWPLVKPPTKPKSSILPSTAIFAARASPRRSSSPPSTSSAAPQSTAPFSNSANTTSPLEPFTNATASSPPAAARRTTTARPNMPYV